MIRNAVKSDLHSIVSIAKENQLKPNEKQKGGFLVSNYSEEEYASFIETYRHFYVIEKEGIVVGFLMAYTKEEMDSENSLYQMIIRRAKNPYVILKQIAIKKNAQKQGFASRLYQYFMHTIKEDIYLSVVLNPYNKSSMDFHKKMEFYLDFEADSDDGYRCGVLYWNNPNAKPFFEVTIILKQYENAAALYRHEDNLNWTKLNHLFYISASLVAAVVLSATLSEVTIFHVGMLFAALVGVSTSLLFYFSIKNGIVYMKKRKEALIALEHILLRHGGAHMVQLPIEDCKKTLQTSPTERMLKILPLVILGLWILVFSISIYLLITN